MHSDELKRLAGEAEGATRGGDLTRALAAWRAAIDLLPPQSEQSRSISARIVALSDRVDAPPPARSSWVTRAGPLGVLALLLWKFKFGAALLLTKGKLLVLGLTKTSTLFSMLLSLGVYWTAWGWKFALGFVVSMYVHEMGHVAALQRYGIKATAPMFIPGLGALVRLKQYPATAVEDARVGLAGPLWGFGAAVAAYAIYAITNAPIWAGIAQAGAWLNLLNLLPVWQLDGGRGFRALSRGQRWLAVAGIGATWAATGAGMLGFLLLFGGLRALAADAPRESDRMALAQYVFLVVGLAVMSTIPVPGVPGL